MDNRLHYLSNRDRQFILIISTFVVFSFVFNMAIERRWGHDAMTDLERGIGVGGLVAIFWFSLGTVVVSMFVKRCLRPDLMRIIFVIAFLLSIIGFLKQNSILSSTAFYSIVLFPFLLSTNGISSVFASV